MAEQITDSVPCTRQCCTGESPYDAYLREIRKRGIRRWEWAQNERSNG